MKPQESTLKRKNSSEKTVDLSLNARTASWSMAFFFSLLCIFFFAGYYLGHKNAIARFTQKLEQESFADHIYAALCGMQDAQECNGDDQASDADDGVTACSVESEPQALLKSIEKNNDPVVVDAAIESEEDVAPILGTQGNRGEIAYYYAQLAGFGTDKAAQRMAARLCRKGIPVFVKKRNSRSAKGKLVSWYQVVTEQFQEKEKLQVIVARIKKEENLSDVNLVSC